MLEIKQIKSTRKKVEVANYVLTEHPGNFNHIKAILTVI